MPGDAKRVAQAVFMLAVGLACLLPVAWPGDTPWVNDEPNLLANALRANAIGHLAPIGLFGSFGVPYGPLATQIYQVLLLLTHDPIKVVAVRAAICMAGTAAGLAWLGRTLRLTRWFIPAMLLSPYLWLFSRILWDNTFAIPIGAVGMAAYASFLAHRSGRSLVAAAGCGLALLSVHFMTAPLVFAVGCHLLWRHRDELWRHRAGLAVVIALAGASNAGYLACGARWGWAVASRGAGVIRQAQSAHAASMAARAPPVDPSAPPAIDPTVVPAAPSRPSHLAAMLFPLLGGRMLSGESFYVDIDQVGPAPLTRVARAMSCLGFAFVWAGMARAAWRTWRLWRGPERFEPRDTLAATALVALLLQMAMFGAMRVAPWNHYFTGMSIVYLLFAWLAVDSLRPVPLRGSLLGVYGASLGLLTMCSLASIHQAGGVPGHFGPSLASQVEVARAAGRYSDATAVTAVTHYLEHPHALWVLRQLLPAADRPSPLGARLVIRYRASAGPSARVELVELAPPDAWPAGAWPIRLTGRAGTAPASLLPPVR